MQRVMIRRARWLQHSVIRLLGYDKSQQLWHQVVAIWLWRRQRGRKIRPQTPAILLPIAVGADAELSITGICDKTACFVQVDLPAHALRWSSLIEHSLSLHSVDKLTMTDSAARGRRSSLRISIVDSVHFGGMRRASQPDPKQSTVPEIQIWYTDRHGCARKLVLRVPRPKSAEWHRALQEVLAASTTVCTHASYRRWALACMESVGGHGEMASVHRSRLRALLNRVRHDATQQSGATDILLAEFLSPAI